MKAKKDDSEHPGGQLFAYYFIDSNQVTKQVMLIFRSRRCRSQRNTHTFSMEALRSPNSQPALTTLKFLRPRPDAGVGTTSLGSTRGHRKSHPSVVRRSVRRNTVMN